MAIGPERRVEQRLDRDRIGIGDGHKVEQRGNLQPARGWTARAAAISPRRA
jgi:hypothetical protein